MEQEIRFRYYMALLALPIQPTLLALVATVMVWIAFLRAEWSDRLLFSAAAILSSTVVLGGTEEIFYQVFHQWYGSSMVCAGAIAYTACLLIAHRARNPVFAVLSILAILYSLLLPYYAMYYSVLDIIGGVLFGGGALCSSFFIAERAGVKPFAAAG